MPFDGERRALWEVEELRQGQPVTMASGWFKGLLMRERLDAQAAERRRKGPGKEEVRMQSVLGDLHREPSVRLLEAWAPVEEELRQRVERDVFEIWLGVLHPHALLDGAWRLAYDVRAVRWVEARFGAIVRECAGRPVVFVACEMPGAETA